MVSIPLSGCLGLDTRPAWRPDDFALVTADNLQVKPGGSIECRPALVKVADLSALSVGLYSRGDFLRCVVPSGHSTQLLAPTGVIYDGIGRGGSYDYAGKIAAVLGAETFGVSQVHGPHGYVAIRRSDTGVIEHHWIKEPPVSAASFTDTHISLPFQPGAALTKVEKHLVATDPANGYFRYCSVLLGPENWVAVGDAGFEAALQFVSGAREMTSLGVHRGALAVFFADAVQLWQMDVDPANIRLLETLNGPGTSFPGSVANVHGDIHFLGRGGFSNLENAKDTGQATYADIGDRVKTLTDAIATTATPVSVWSEKRGQYLVAIGTTVYCYSIYPRAGETAWTRWTLPVAVDAMAENLGVVSIRSGNVLYRLDDTVGRDSGATADIAWLGQTRNLGGPKAAVARVKALNELIVQCTAQATWTPLADGRLLTGAAVRIPGDDGPRRTGLGGSGRRVALRFAGTGLVRIDGAQMNGELCGL